MLAQTFISLSFLERSKIKKKPRKIYYIFNYTYRHVYKAKEKKSAQIVALKKIRLESSQQGVGIL
jgi:hypothetical protein